MAFVLPEIAAEAGGAEAAGAAEGGGGLGGMLKDFNDNPIGRLIGAHYGEQAISGVAHTAESAIGTQPSGHIGGYVIPD
jgi:hypothetical protein